MGLIHWWPLNGDTKDYGANALPGTLIGSASVTSTAGKIGKCLEAGNGVSQNSAGVEIPSNLTDELANTDYTFTVWIKIKGTHANYEGAIISSGNWNQTCWAFGIAQDNRSIDPAGNWYHEQLISYTFEIGKWYHIASVQRGNTSYVYVNGVYIGSKNKGHISGSSANVTHIGRETYAGGYFSFNGNINDLRIYDHALSAAEIHELSKGLVLHYALEDPYVEGTTNILPAAVRGLTATQGGYWGGTTSLETFQGYKCLAVHNNTTNSYTDGTILAGTTLTSGTVYTASAQIWTPCSVRFSIRTNTGGYGTSVTVPGDSMWHHVTFTFTASSATLNGQVECVETVANSTSYTWYIRDIQLEEKDHVTPFINGTRASSLLPDSSGYNYHGTINGGLPIIEDNGYGHYAVRYDTTYTHNIQAGLNPDFLVTGCTLSMWIKNNRDFLLANGQTFDYFMMAMDRATKWSGRVAGTIKYYVDGVENSGSRPTDGNWHLYTITTDGGLNGWTELYFNRHDQYWVIDGNVADIKLYATALSAADVLAEYQRKAYITKTNVLCTPEFYENPNSQELLFAAIGSDTIYKDSGVGTIAYDATGAMRFTNKVWGRGPKIPVTAGETLEFDCSFSNVSGNVLYIGFEHFNANGGSDSNEGCVYTVYNTSTTTKARAHQSFTVTATAGGSSTTHIRLRILNDWGSSTSDSHIATLHYISLRRVNGSNKPNIAKPAFVEADEFREDGYSKASIYKNGFVAATTLVEN